MTSANYWFQIHSNVSQSPSEFANVRLDYVHGPVVPVEAVLSLLVFSSFFFNLLLVATSKTWICERSKMRLFPFKMEIKQVE